MNELKKKKKILLGLLPFWTPLIPPMAISYLKTYLKRYGYSVTITDLNIEVEFKELYHAYFNQLKEFVDKEKRVNFYNIGHDVLQNHMTAHIQYEDQTQYMELVKILIYQNYYFQLNEQQVSRLNQVLDRFYLVLEKHLLRLLENPNLLEHESFTELLRAVFHLAEELSYRNDFSKLPDTDYNHLAGDIKRSYTLLVRQWLDYMKYLNNNYPYLCSLAMRTNPFDQDASPIVT